MATPPNQQLNSVSLQSPSYSVSSACKLVGTSARQLYYWESLGIVQPIYQEFGTYSYRRYSEKDISLLREVKRLIDTGFTLRAAAQKVTGKNFTGRNGNGGNQNGSHGNSFHH